MKKIILAILAALPLCVHADPAVSPVDRSQVFMMPLAFTQGDGISEIARGSSAASEPWIGKATSTSVTALVLSPTTGVSFTATVIMPQNLRERPGNVKLYAIVHYSAATNTGRLRCDIQKLQRLPSTNSLSVAQYLTTTTVYNGFNTADLLTPAASSFTALYIPLSNAASAQLFRKNEVVNFAFQRISGTAAYMEIAGIKIEYDYEYNIPR